MIEQNVFASECVAAGHPDKIADCIADAILKDLYKHDGVKTRAGIEVMVAGLNVVVGGEITSSVHITDQYLREIVKSTLETIGYNKKYSTYFNAEEAISSEDFNVVNFVNRQSPDIAQGVDRGEGIIGAGDQGIYFGYATKKSPTLEGYELYLAKELCTLVYNSIRDCYVAGGDKYLGYGIDIKTQVAYDVKKDEIVNIVVAVPHVETKSTETVHSEIMVLINKFVADNNLTTAADCEYIINGTGRYIIHSSVGDCGITGRKLTIQLAHGGRSYLGGGNDSGKDFSKTDRSYNYLCRQIAKSVVANGYADECNVQLSTAIGMVEPISLNLDCKGLKNGVSIDDLQQKIIENFDFDIEKLIERYSKEDILNVAMFGCFTEQNGEHYDWQKVIKF